MTQTTATKPWYRQFWPWFLIALPGSVVIASVITIILATSQPDTVVVDDYYKAGLAINRDLRLEQQAEHFNVLASLQISDDGKRIQVSAGADDKALPDSLQLQLTHPTLSDLDQSVTLTRLGSNRYQGTLDPLAAGAWNVILESASPQWRIRRRIVTDSGQQRFQLR